MCTTHLRDLPKSGSSSISASLSSLDASASTAFRGQSLSRRRRTIRREPADGTVRFRETINQVVLVLPNAVTQVVGHSDVQDA